MDSDLETVKAKTWFYPFDLPDGSRTRTDYPPDILVIHTTRREALARVLDAHLPAAGGLTALDISSHEGYFSAQLARRFGRVTGLEYRQESIDNAALMMRCLGLGNVEFRRFDIQKAEPAAAPTDDFVLLYGLMYHLENPVHALRVACSHARAHLMIDTQIFPYEIEGRIEDSAWKHQRPVHGVFALTPDYSAHREGGSTDWALVPSLNALKRLLLDFGFAQVEVLEPLAGEYEQYHRRNRVLIHARRA